MNKGLLIDKDGIICRVDTMITGADIFKATLHK